MACIVVSCEFCIVLSSGTEVGVLMESCEIGCIVESCVMPRIVESGGVRCVLSVFIFMTGMPGIDGCASFGLGTVSSPPCSIPVIPRSAVGIAGSDAIRFGRTRT